MLPAASFQPMTTAFRSPATCALVKVVATVLCGLCGTELLTWTKVGVAAPASKAGSTRLSSAPTVTTAPVFIARLAGPTRIRMLDPLAPAGRCPRSDVAFSCVVTGTRGEGVTGCTQGQELSLRPPE